MRLFGSCGQNLPDKLHNAVRAFFKMRFCCHRFFAGILMAAVRIFHESRRLFDKVWVAPGLFSKKLAVRAFLQGTIRTGIEPGLPEYNAPVISPKSTPEVAVGAFMDLASFRGGGQHIAGRTSELRSLTRDKAPFSVGIEPTTRGFSVLCYTT